MRARKILFNPSIGSPKTEASNVLAFFHNVLQRCIVLNQRVSKDNEVLVFVFRVTDPLRLVDFAAVVTSRPLACAAAKTHHRSIDDEINIDLVMHIIIFNITHEHHLKRCFIWDFEVCESAAAVFELCALENKVEL